MNHATTLLKVVGGQDQGGVRSCELAFTSRLRERNIRVVGVILGDGVTTSQYRNAFDDSVVVPCSLRTFGVGKFDRLKEVLRNEVVSSRFAKDAASEVGPSLAGAPLLGIAVRRSYYLKVAGVLGQLLGAPVFWHMCDSVNDPFGRRYYKSLLSRYGIVPIGNSRYTIRTLLGPADTAGAFVYPGFWPERLRVDASRPGYRDELGIPADAPVFGMVSRLTADKAVDVIIDAFLASEAFRSGAHLLIAGGPTDSDYARWVASRAAQLGGGKIHMLGDVADVSRAYAALDVLINGRRNAEPFGISIVEGMAAGIPVLAYRKGGPEETISDGVTGWLTDAPNMDAYQAALDRAWRMRGEWKTMGNSARSAAEAFSTHAQVDRYIATLRANAWREAPAG